MSSSNSIKSDLFQSNGFGVNNDFGWTRGTVDILTPIFCAATVFQVGFRMRKVQASGTKKNSKTRATKTKKSKVSILKKKKMMRD